MYRTYHHLVCRLCFYAAVVDDFLSDDEPPQDVVGVRREIFPGIHLQLVEMTQKHIVEFRRLQDAEWKSAYDCLGFNTIIPLCVEQALRRVRVGELCRVYALSDAVRTAGEPEERTKVPFAEISRKMAKMRKREREALSRAKRQAMGLANGEWSDCESEEECLDNFPAKFEVRLLALERVYTLNEARTVAKHVLVANPRGSSAPTPRIGDIVTLEYSENDAARLLNDPANWTGSHTVSAALTAEVFSADGLMRAISTMREGEVARVLVRSEKSDRLVDLAVRMKGWNRVDVVKVFDVDGLPVNSRLANLVVHPAPVTRLTLQSRVDDPKTLVGPTTGTILVFNARAMSFEVEAAGRDMPEDHNQSNAAIPAGDGYDQASHALLAAAANALAAASGDDTTHELTEAARHLHVDTPLFADPDSPLRRDTEHASRTDAPPAASPLALKNLQPFELFAGVTPSLATPVPPSAPPPSGPVSPWRSFALLNGFLAVPSCLQSLINSMRIGERVLALIPRASFAAAPGVSGPLALAPGALLGALGGAAVIGEQWAPLTEGRVRECMPFAEANADGTGRITDAKIVVNPELKRAVEGRARETEWILVDLRLEGIASQSADVFDLSEEDKIFKARLHRELGNLLTKDGMWIDAAAQYFLALDCIRFSQAWSTLGLDADFKKNAEPGQSFSALPPPESVTSTPEWKQHVSDTRELGCAINMNLSLCHLKATARRDALVYAKAAVQIQPENIKAHLRVIAAHQSMGELQHALEAIKIAQELDAENPALTAFKDEIIAEQKSHEDKVRKMFAGKLFG